MNIILSRELKTKAWLEEENENHIFIQGELIDDRHHILSVIKFDYKEEKVIEIIKTQWIKSPYTYCSDIKDIINRIIGLEVKTGATAFINKNLGGKDGCIHLAEVVVQIFKCFYQVVHRIEDLKLSSEDERKKRKFKVLRNSCYAYTEKFKDMNLD
ncbi:MAG: DUF2889 domain-containing protein [Eubacteriales bacterium]|nr:DUF2889 domain-containing protein [Eubacteriales bacterium]